MPRLRFAAVLVMLVTGLAACGGATGTTPAGTPDTPAGEPTDGSPAETTSAGGGSTDIPSIAAGTFKAATAHLEMSGDRSGSMDAEGTAMAVPDFTLLTFVGTKNDGTLQIAFGGADGSVVTAQLGTTATAGNIGSECNVGLSRNDATGVTGEFSCPNLEAIDGATVVTVAIQGTFSADR
jgi:hypothetical protein